MPNSHDGEKCQRPGCTGTITDGFCSDCGRPPSGQTVLNPASATPTLAASSGVAPSTAAASIGASSSAGEQCQQPGCHGIIVDGFCSDCGRPPLGQSVLNPTPVPAPVPVAADAPPAAQPSSPPPPVAAPAPIMQRETASKADLLAQAVNAGAQRPAPPTAPRVAEQRPRLDAIASANAPREAVASAPAAAIPSLVPAARSASPALSSNGAASGATHLSTPLSAPTFGTHGTAPSRRGTRRGKRNRDARRQLGAGLIALDPLPPTDPLKSLMADATVPDAKRRCPQCAAKLSHEKGFCPMCGSEYSFLATLQAGDVLEGQYEIKGPLAFGGLGWIYLGWDNLLSRWVVLKGLLNIKDEASAYAAMQERKFLASVKHPNIVGVYNFVTHGKEGFIVMEYVGGKSLKALRQERGPLPPAEAVAYVHRIFSAFAYLWRMGLVYCDFKPDNFMLEEDDVKLIDMGGVRHADDLGGDVYGTKGYSAPEATDHPSFASDLYTVARTLAVMVINFPFTARYEFSLPSPAEEPLFDQHESLYRWLMKATRQNPDERFHSAEEAADQLLGVLRELVAEKSGPIPQESAYFVSGDLTPVSPFEVRTLNGAGINGAGLADGSGALTLNGVNGTADSNVNGGKPHHNGSANGAALANNKALPGKNNPLAGLSYKLLPGLKVDADDLAANALLSVGSSPDPAVQVENLKRVYLSQPDSAEAKLRWADARNETGDYVGTEALLAEVAQADSADWRAWWYRGRSLLAQRQGKAAWDAFQRVYSEVPGEIAPKLALALAAEANDDLLNASRFFDLVSRVDAGFAGGAFGLARILLRQHNRNGAASALGRIQPASPHYLRAQTLLAHALLSDTAKPPTEGELIQAARVVESLRGTLDSYQMHRLASDLLLAAAIQIESKAFVPSSSSRLLGSALDIKSLRSGAERELRECARYARTPHDKIALIDEANRVRPQTLF